jgi:hypothetical protein
MVGITTYLCILTLNINGLNSPTTKLPHQNSFHQNTSNGRLDYKGRPDELLFT